MYFTKMAISIFILLGSLSMIAATQAEIYRWQDEKGKWHFTDKPYNNPKAEVMELEPLNGMTAVDIPEDLFKEQKVGKKSRQITVARGAVLMFSTPDCGYCVQAKKYMQKKNIPFTEKDVSQPGPAQKQFVALGGRGVPLLLVGTKDGTKKMSGFSEARLAAALGI